MGREGGVAEFAVLYCLPYYTQLTICPTFIKLVFPLCLVKLVLLLLVLLRDITSDRWY